MGMHNPPHPGEFIYGTYIEPYGTSIRTLAESLGAVSYTHLTLPTILLV